MELFWKLVSKPFFNKAQRKNFYKAISAVGLKKYLELKKIIREDAKEPKQFKYNVSIVAIAKNEGIYFKEWIEYHKLIGVDHFYIYNNESTDNIREVLDPYIKSGLVTFTDFPGKERQGPAYNDAIAKYKNETRWLCPLDLDEFICLKKHNDINEFMENFNDCFQVSLHWMYFGSSGHEKQPKGLVIESFTKRAKKCYKSIKSIFNPRTAVDAMPVHYVIGVGKWVDEHHVDIGDAKDSVDIAQINHYFVKSKEEFVNRKTARGSNSTRLTIKDIEKSFREHDFNDVDDNIMQKYADKLKSVMKN